VAPSLPITVGLPAPTGVRTVAVSSAVEMHEAVRRECADADALVMAAAVADFRPATAADQKLKKSEGTAGTTIDLVENPDIIGSTPTSNSADAAVPAAQSEAKAFFGNGEVYLERYLERPRHIEVQILGDGHGGVIHLGERDCSLQRKHQKILEETPSPALNAGERQHLGRIATDAMRKLGYRSAGTIEFLYQDGQFFFIEMNTRLQVEHPISEMVSGIDIVREQIRIAAGAALGYRQEDVKLSGHAIECRINAEHPETFAPSPGTILRYHVPGGLGVRVDSALYQGYTVPPNYDSLVAKLIVHGGTRNECLMRLRRSLEEYVIAGIDTTIPLHQRLVAAPDFINGDYDIHWLERFLARA
jgi:acetyl-CoA carboxylase biotin carboxylase subunit